MMETKFAVGDRVRRNPDTGRRGEVVKVFPQLPQDLVRVFWVKKTSIVKASDLVLIDDK